MSTPFLTLRGIDLQPGDRQLCRDLNLELREGESWALLGSNGSGKTSLLLGILGLRPVASGEILIHGKPLAELSRRQLAAQVGILFQDNIPSMPATVLESVLIGRHPHARSLLFDDPGDLKLAREIMTELDLSELGQRQVDTLSGGERQRLAMAMLMAQQPDLYLLDEPSNHLDVAFQVRLLGKLQNKLRQRHASMIMATHDINLASRFCDQVLLLFGNGEWSAGPRREILTGPTLSHAFGCEIVHISQNGQDFYYPA